MVRVAIVCKPRKEELARLVPDLIEWLRAHDYEPRLDHEGGQYTSAAPAMERSELPSWKPSLVIVLGGDGTLLSVARIFAAEGTPILSVNLGLLGFLTEVRLGDLYSTLESWCDGCHSVDERSMLHAALWRVDGEHSSYTALNEIVVSKGDIARMGDFAVELDGKSVPRRRGDCLNTHRLHGVHAGRERPDPDSGCGCHGGDADLPAPAHAAAHRGAWGRIAHSPGGGRSGGGIADRGRPAGG
jgi:NAD+ kinase